jgi:hypothetical protein
VWLIHLYALLPRLRTIIHAAHTIKRKVDNNTQVVFLPDALSVLQAVMNDNLPQLEQALYTINTPRTTGP